VSYQFLRDTGVNLLFYAWLFRLRRILSLTATSQLLPSKTGTTLLHVALDLATQIVVVARDELSGLELPLVRLEGFFETAGVHTHGVGLEVVVPAASVGIFDQLVELCARDVEVHRRLLLEESEW